MIWSNEHIVWAHNMRPAYLTGLMNGLLNVGIFDGRRLCPTRYRYEEGPWLYYLEYMHAQG